MTKDILTVLNSTGESFLESHIDNLRNIKYNETFIEDFYLKNILEKLDDKINTKDYLSFVIKDIGKIEDIYDEYLILDKPTGTLKIIKLPFDEKTGLHINNLPDSQIIVFKLFPLTATEKQLNRAREKGIKEVVPDFLKIIDRGRKVRDGEATLYRSTTVAPAIMYGTDKTTNKVVHFNIGNRDIKLDNFYFLPRIKMIHQDISNSSIPIFVTMDYVDSNRLPGKSALNCITALVDKKGGYSIDKKDLMKLWRLSSYIIYSSLYSHNFTPDFIVLPSSSGGYINTVREILRKNFPKTEIITLKKPCQKDLLKYYSNNKDKYDKIFKETCYTDQDAKDQNNIGDVFYNNKGQLYEFWGDVSGYENRVCKVPKIAKVMSSPHRALVTKIMSDYNIDTLKLTKLSGNIIILDDDIISGSTLVNFLHHTIERSIKDENKSNTNIITFAFIAKKSTQREASYINGVERNSGFNEK